MCEIEEIAAGLYELVLRQPITGDGRAFLLKTDRIVRASAPVRETPEMTIRGADTATVTRDIWRVKTNGSRLHLRAKPNGKIIGAYPPGTQVVKYGESSVAGWWGVIVCDGGAKGYMYSQYLEHVGEVTENVAGDSPGEVIRPRQLRDQLFRIYSVASDSAGRFIEARARHISYDIAGAVVNGPCVLENVPAAQACAQFLALADHDPGVAILCGAEGAVSGDFTGMSLWNCLLDPQIGVAVQTGARVLRDNFDFLLLPPSDRVHDGEIRYGKNLKTARFVQDSSRVVTRIIPVGKNAQGDDLTGDAVDSPHIGDYPVVRTARVRYDVKAGKDLSEAQALEALRKLAQKDIDAGCDLLSVGLKSDFVRLELAEKYAQAANEYALHLYDSVPVIDRSAGIDLTVQMTGYRFDVLRRRYTATYLGDITAVRQQIDGERLADGSVGGAKIAKNAVGGVNLRSASIDMAHIKTAAIDQLSAKAVTAIRADVRDLVAGNITTDQLYADLAAIAAAQITAANIEKANIDWAQIDTLLASIAEIASAEIGTADIDYAKVKDMVTDTAIITEGVGGRLYINRLAVTDANMVSLTAGELLLRNEAGDLVRLTVDGDGNVTGTVVQVEGGNIAENTVSGGNLIENTITARELNVASIFADSALIRAIKAANIDVADLFAADATITALDNYVLRTATIEALEDKLDLWAQEKIDLAVGNVQIGGTNLIRETGWHEECAPGSAGWDSVGVGISRWPYDQYPNADDFYTEGFILFTESNTGSDIWSPYLKVKEGETYTLSFRHRGSRMQAIWAGMDADSTLIWAPSKTYDTYLTSDYSETRTIPTGVAQLRIVFRSTAGLASVFGRVKLEKGNKATAWSPNPRDKVRTAGSVVKGSALNITEEGVNIETPVFSVNVSGTNGDMSISENGMSINQINSPSVRQRYTGPTTLYVLDGADGVNVFATLGDVFAKLSGKFLPEMVTIHVGKSTADNAELKYTTGAIVNVIGNGNTITGSITLGDVASRIDLDNLVIASPTGANCLYAYNCRDVRVTNATFRADSYNNGYYMCCVNATDTNMSVTNCAMWYGFAGLMAEANSRVYMDACKGNYNTYAILCRSGSAVGIATSRPSGDGGIYCSGDSIVRGATDAYNEGSGTTQPSQPAATTTVALTATNSRTYAGGWYDGTNVLTQGKAAVNGSAVTFYGYIWFDTSAISGKTIKAAKIRLYRQAGLGSGNPVTVRVGTHNCAAPHSSLSIVTEYADIIGSVDQKETLEAAIPAAAVQQIANGTAKGLYLYGPAASYARFDGFDGAIPPVLTVTYA